MSDKFVCYKCFSEKVIARYIQKHGSIIKRCNYCNAENVKGLNIKSISDFIGEGIRKKYDLRQKIPEEHIEALNIPSYTAKELLQEELRVFSARCNHSLLVDDIFKALILSWKDITDGADNFYNGENEYLIEGNFIEHSKHRMKWECFKEKVMHKERYFYNDRNDFLISFKKLITSCKGYITNLEAGTSLFRAREINLIFNLPYECNEAFLGPPPQPQSNPKMSRMNPIGISYFYLSSSPKTAKKEINEREWSVSIVGKFTVLKNLKILDLTNCPKITLPSIFSVKYDPDKEYLEEFLKSFRDEISQSVGQDQEINYIPTQILSEFINICGFDGLMFKSAQHPRGKNYTLFFGGDDQGHLPDFREYMRLKSITLPDGNQKIYQNVSAKEEVISGF